MTWNIEGKKVLVTGATSGIGLTASIELARRGAHLVLVGRDRARCENALARVQPFDRGASYLLCDFSSQASIRALASDLLAKHDRLEVLVNNAGGVHKTRTVTADGIEATFAVNHLGYFLLTNLLLERLIASAPARVVTVSSVGHRRGTLDFDDLGFEHGYSIMRAYTRSKLANVLFANELSRRLVGKQVTSNSVHPGAVDTNIWTGAPNWAKPVLSLFARPFFISAEEGGATIVELAVNPELENVSGRYFEKNHPVEPSRLARDAELGQRLWQVSTRLVHLE